MFRKFFFTFVILSILFSFSAHSVYSTFSFKIDEVAPSDITSKDTEVKVKIVITDLPSESYFRVSWQRSPGDHYFGYMKNEKGEWIQTTTLSDNCNSLYKVTDTSTATLDLVTKIGDFDPDPGSYSIKAHRYTTTSCSSPHEADNTSQVTVNLPIPTATATPVPTPTDMPQPSNTPSPSKTPTTTVKSNATTNLKITPLPTKAGFLDKENHTSPTQGEENGIVLAQSDIKNDISPTPQNTILENSSFINGAKITLILGLLFLGTGVMILTQRLQKFS